VFYLVSTYLYLCFITPNFMCYSFLFYSMIHHDVKAILHVYLYIFKHV